MNIFAAFRAFSIAVQAVLRLYQDGFTFRTASIIIRNFACARFVHKILFFNSNSVSVSCNALSLLSKNTLSTLSTAFTALHKVVLPISVLTIEFARVSVSCREHAINPFFTSNLYGYNAKEILVVLGTNINRENEKKVRKQLRLLISKQLYPEFATAGNEDIVYCPDGKGSGTYRLSKYR